MSAIRKAVRSLLCIGNRAWVMRIGKELSHTGALLESRKAAKEDWSRRFSQRPMKKLQGNSEIAIHNKILRAGALRKSNQARLERIAAKLRYRVSRNLVLSMRVAQQRVMEARESWASKVRDPLRMGSQTRNSDMQAKRACSSPLQLIRLFMPRPSSSTNGLWLRKHSKEQQDLEQFLWRSYRQE